jgi:hypothetical protein
MQRTLRRRQRDIHHRQVEHDYELGRGDDGERRAQPPRRGA